METEKFESEWFTAGIQRRRCGFQAAEHHRDAMAKPTSGLDPLQSKPLTNNRSNLIHLVGCQHAKATHQFRMRDRDDVLRIEDARLEKPRRHGDFEIRSPRTRCVGDDGRE
jgi:hypothetical protein